MPVIATNTAANTAVRYLNTNAADQSSSLAKLASGSRITKASDDAAGIAISTRLNADVTTLTQAATNSSHAQSVLQTADGGASNISDILERMETLATEAASGTVTDDDRTYIESEFSQLVDQVNTIATGTRYNGQSLLDGTSSFSSGSGGTTVVVGSSSSDTINVSIGSLTSDDLGLTTTANVTTANDFLTDKVDLSSASADSSFTITDGSATTTITLAKGSSYTGQDILNALNGSTVTGITVDNPDNADTTYTVDSAGKLTITSGNVGTSTTLTVAGDSSTLTSLGMTTTTTTAATAAESTTTSGATITADNTNDRTFTVTDTSSNALSIKLSSGTTDYSASDIAAAINDYVTNGGTSSTNYATYTAMGITVTGDTATDVTAAVGTNGLTFTTSATGTGTALTVADDASHAVLGTIANNDGTASTSSTATGMTDTGGSTLSVSTQDAASSVLDKLSSAINTVSEVRAEIGAQESRFEFTSDSISTSIENLESASSAITDVDVASEEAKLASSQVMVQAAVAAASSANQMTQNLLKLMQ